MDDYPSVNLLVRKDAFTSISGFPVQYWPGEDTKLCLDLTKKFGKLFVYDPRPIVYHHRRNVFIPHLKQISRYGKHRGRFAKIFPETSRLPSYFIPSLFVLGTFLGPFICLILPFLWHPYFSVLFVYLAVVFVESLRVGIKDKSLRMSLYVGVGIMLTHIVYGVNFLAGFIRAPGLELRKVDVKTGNYLGG